MRAVFKDKSNILLVRSSLKQCSIYFKQYKAEGVAGVLMGRTDHVWMVTGLGTHRALYTMQSTATYV